MDHAYVTYVLSFIAGTVGGMSYILHDREIDTKREIAAGIIRPGCVGLSIALIVNNWTPAPLMIGASLLAGMAGEAGFTVAWHLAKTAALRFIKSSIEVIEEEDDPYDSYRRRRRSRTYDDHELEEWPDEG